MSNFSWTWENGPPGYHWPNTIRVEFDLNISGSPCTSTDTGDCPAPIEADVTLRVEAADETTVKEQSWSLGASSTPISYPFSFACDKIPYSYTFEITPYCAHLENHVCSGPTADTPVSGPSGTIPEPPFACSAQAHTCAKTENLELTYFKRGGQDMFIRTIPSKDAEAFLVGEAVNGQLEEMPYKTLLFVNISQPSAGVSMRGGTAGWQTPSGREGAELDGTCIAMNAGDRYEFNVWGEVGDVSSTFEAGFEAYWYDSFNRKVIHTNVKTLSLAVQPIECQPVNSEVIFPSIFRQLVEPGFNNYQLRLPCCDESGTGLTDWFTAWPTAEGGRIPKGRAIDWRINNGVVVEPDPNGKQNVPG